MRWHIHPTMKILCVSLFVTFVCARPKPNLPIIDLLEMLAGKQSTHLFAKLNHVVTDQEQHQLDSHANFKDAVHQYPLNTQDSNRHQVDESSQSSNAGCSKQTENHNHVAEDAER
jgi:hypothetical protein